MTAMSNENSLHPGRPANHQRAPTLHMLDDDMLNQHLLLDDEDSATVDNSIMPLRTAQPSFMSRVGAPSLHTSHSFLGFNNNGEPLNQHDYNNNDNNTALTSQNIQQHNYNYSANNSNNHSNHSSHKTFEVTAQAAPLQLVTPVAVAAPNITTSQVHDAGSSVHNQNSHSSSGQNSRPTSSAGRHMLSVSGLGDVLVSSAHGAQGSGIIIHSTTHRDDQPSPVPQNSDSNNNINDSINADETDLMSAGRSNAALEILKQQSSRSNSSSPVVSLMSASQRSPRVSPRHDQRVNLVNSFIQSSSPQQQASTTIGNGSNNEGDYSPENLLGSLPAAGRYARPGSSNNSNNSSNESAPNSAVDVDADVASS